MPKYKVLINGANFLIDMDDRIAKFGFFTTRFVEATDADAAENTAVRMIREAQRLRDLVRNAPDDPPVMYVTGITEMVGRELLAERHRHHQRAYPANPLPALGARSEVGHGFGPDESRVARSDH